MQYSYTEYVSKNHDGGLKQIRQITKKVHQYGSDDVSNALILDSYISNLPREVKAKDLFHMKPKKRAQKDLILPWLYADWLAATR